MKFTHVAYKFSRPSVLVVGSRIVIKKKLPLTDDGVGTNTSMTSRHGKKARITRIESNHYHGKIYRLDIDKGAWAWTENMFEK